MATQSLYRRYRPRRFSEVKGQEHVVRALRNAVINNREGQAYLFSGPRGTGKTTSARILAKVLNCENPTAEGEPCCECASCVAVERGTSFDVHELDAASNSGVEAMRDLIEKASLGTPGRHKVYILDEVHMLSKSAEAALLKTLEEPPAHVVFVLATTDPQKVSDTIRSRTQHLLFHLLPMDVLEEHITWLAHEEGIELDEAAMQSVLRQGGGSARDTVSALELVASGGSDAAEFTPLDEFVEAFIEHDPGRALTVVALASQQGRDARTLTEEIVRHLRDCFLSIMAPELVQLPAQRQVEVSALAERLGAAAIVRAMERLGEILVEMRHAPDARLLLEVALVQLTHRASDVDLSVILDRVERLEQQMQAGASVAAAAAKAAPVDPATGRAAIGGRARATAPAPSAPVDPAPVDPAPVDPAPVDPAPAPVAPVVPAPVDPAPVQSVKRPAGSPSESGATVTELAVHPAVAADHPVSQGPRPIVAGDAAAQAAALWVAEILPSLKGFGKALYAATKLVGQRDGSLVLGAPNETHRTKCEQYRTEVEAAITKVVGAKVPVSLTVDGLAAHDEPDHNVVQLKRAASVPEADESEIDLSDLVDAPPDSVVSPIDRLAQAFPGSEIIDERT